MMKEAPWKPSQAPWKLQVCNTYIHGWNSCPRIQLPKAESEVKSESLQVLDENASLVFTESDSTQFRDLLGHAFQGT
jgi:hypothetical protein